MGGSLSCFEDLHIILGYKPIPLRQSKTDSTYQYWHLGKIRSKRVLCFVVSVTAGKWQSKAEWFTWRKNLPLCRFLPAAFDVARSKYPFYKHLLDAPLQQFLTCYLLINFSINRKKSIYALNFLKHLEKTSIWHWDTFTASNRSQPYWPCNIATRNLSFAFRI